MKKKALMIVGPTAVGKTDTAIFLAKKLEGEIISADSMQIYKKMQIGTAKPTEEEQEGIPHHLMDCVDPGDTNFTVAVFQQEALARIDDITGRGKLPIIVGGTGLYANALLYQMDFTSSQANQALRTQLEQEAKEKGNDFLHQRLAQLDPRAAERIHPNNVKRVIRALEVNLESGENIKAFAEEKNPHPHLEWLVIGLTRDREELYDRINQRVELMLQAGLLEEVRQLLAEGYDEGLPAMQSLGYKELIPYLRGEGSYEEAITLLKRDTRHYAKRQLTWFGRYDFIHWYNLSRYPEKDNLFSEILDTVEGHFHLLANR